MPYTFLARRLSLVLVVGVFAASARADIAQFYASSESSLSVISIPAGIVNEAPTNPYLPANTPLVIGNGTAILNLGPSINPTSANPGFPTNAPIATTLTLGGISGTAQGEFFYPHPYRSDNPYGWVSHVSRGYSYGLVFKNLDTKSNTLTVNYSFDSVVSASARGSNAGAEATSALSLVEFDLGTGDTLKQISLVSDDTGWHQGGFSPFTGYSSSNAPNSSGSFDFTLAPSQEVGFRLVGAVSGIAVVPEPSPLILACVGLLASAGLAWRRRAAGSTASLSS